MQVEDGIGRVGAVFVEFAYKWTASNGEKYWKRNIFIEPAQVETYRRRRGNVDCYTSIMQIDDPARGWSEGLLYGPLVMDFDREGGAEAFEAVRRDSLAALSYLDVVLRVPKRLVRCCFSGSKGVHLIVPPEVLGIEPTQRLYEAYKLVAKDAAAKGNLQCIDYMVYIRTALLRLENSRHSKSGLYKIPLTYEELRSLSYEEIVELARRPRQLEQSFAPSAHSAHIIRGYIAKARELSARPKPSRERTLTLGKLPPCIERMMAEEPKPHTRNNTTCCLASFFMQAGAPQEEAAAMLLSWNAKLRFPLEEDEILKTVDKMYAKGYTYGCTTHSQIGGCDRSRCPLF